MTVVDASALAALLFGEPDADAVASRLATEPLTAPTLIELELASVCARKCRRFPAERARLTAAFVLRERFGLTLVQVPGQAALRLALDNQLTPYDAAYLWLARHLGAPLVTLDARLAEAAAA